MKTSVQYVLRCGQFYLGPKYASRVNNFESAVRFDVQEVAEARAAELRGAGIFRLPWMVVPIPTASVQEATR
jgi:hypothetical protein